MSPSPERLKHRPGLAADVELSGGRMPGGHARIAIASYEFNGIVRNGGIGTACTSLALALAADGHEVDLFFTGWAEDQSDEGFERWREHYEGLGVALHWLDHDKATDCDTILQNARHSLALYELLRAHDERRPYDVIHFVESVGHGFYSLLAKRQGLAFRMATTVVGVHSPRRWMAEAHAVPFSDPLELADERLELRSVELADVVVSPSAHMLDWLENRGVRLPERSYVQQYIVEFDPAEAQNGDDPADEVEELVFFGRLEPRKGLLIFCDAMDGLARNGDDLGGLRRVTFLGKQVMLGEATSGEYLRGRAEKWPWELSVIDGLDRDAALEYLRGPGRLAVMPSLMDNSPNTVYEALGLGIPFLASRAGGTAELVHPDDFERVTYDPCDPEALEIDPCDPRLSRPRRTGAVLARRLRLALRTAPAPARYAVDPPTNHRAHLEWHRTAAAQPAPRFRVAALVRAPLDLHNLTEATPDDELVLALDPDAECSPRLVPMLVAAADASPDCTFFTPFGSFDAETPEGLTRRIFLPCTGPAAAGLLGSRYGAGAVLARRGALRRIGPFPSAESLAGLSVAELLAGAVVACEKVDVVPEVLYHLPASAVPSGALTTSQGPLDVLAPYYRAWGPIERDIAGMARRMLLECEERRAAIAQTEAMTADIHARLAVIESSRSMRVTAPLRRVAAGVRRLRRPA